jgi:glycosyltransferase involved in cell wall biosynthesis
MTVSVVIPCYNVEQHIAACLRSVLEQDIAVQEIICVDDGSTDGTVRTIRSLQEEYPGRIALLEGEHRGACAARNTGMAVATGTYIQFLDADDVLLPDKLSGQVALLAAHPDRDLVVGDYYVVHGNREREHIKALAHGPWMGLIKTRIGSTCSNLWKRSAVSKAGGWNEELASSQDHELLFRMLSMGCTVAYDQRPCTVVDKARPGRISAADNTGNWLRYIELRVAVREHLRTVDAERFAAEISAADQYIFMAIHLLAKLEPGLAMKLHRDHIPKNFQPGISAAITARYALVHRILGFEKAVLLGRLLGRSKA